MARNPEHDMRSRGDERGNILFLILLAVVLFAALSYAVTQSMRGGDNDATKENADLMAAQIIQYATNVEQAILRMRLSNNCSDTQISFQNDIVTGYTNGAAPASCRVFDANGGGLAWETPPAKALVDVATANALGRAGVGYGAYSISSQTSLTGIGLADTGNSGVGKDLLLGLPYVSDAVCAAVNKQLGLGTVAACAGYYPVGDPNAKFKGTYFSGGGYAAGMATPGARSGCVPGSSYTGNSFFHVILAR